MRKALLLSLAAFLALPNPGRAQDSGDDPSSNEGALFLLLPAGAKAVSMGRAVTAMQGAESVFWNPAGLASVGGRRFMLIRGDHAVGTATSASYLTGRPGLGTLGFSYFLLDVGDQDLTGEGGEYLGTITVRNHLGVASAAARILHSLNAGLNFKIVRFQLTCRGQCPDAGTTATTYAVDAGVQYAPDPDGGLPLRFGAMIAHLGPRLQVLNEDQADPLPARVRLAVAYDVVNTLVDNDQLGGWVTLEVQDHLRDPGSLSYYFGSEFTAGRGDVLSLRAGYALSELDQEDGARVGLGLRYESFELSIAKSLAVSTLTGETEPVHVTFSVVF